MDDRDGEDIACEVDSLPFIMNRELSEIYGSSFRISANGGLSPELEVTRSGVSVAD